MDLRTSLMSIFCIFLLIEIRSSAQENSTTIVASPQVSTVTSLQDEKTNVTTTPLPSLCTICACGLHLVNCSHRNLIDTFVESQWPKTPIPEISFKNNQLVHLKPFPSVTIWKLSLRHNKITTIDDCAFKQIVNLTEIDLSHNELTTENLLPQIFEGKYTPESYEPLAKLTTLNLAYNKLHALNQDVFEHTPSLKVLILFGNPLKMLEGHTTLAISSLPYLEELDLSYCELDELPKHIFYKPRFLKKLKIGGNRFTTIPGALATARSLESLTLDENPIESFDELNAFPAMPKLKELNLYCMAYLSRVGRGAFAQLKALEVLHLNNCPLLEEIDENAFEEEGGVWPPLKNLDISNNALRHLPSQLVARWDRLEELDLMNNEWNCDCNNQYLISTLLPQHGKRLMGDEINQLKCSEPAEYTGRNLTSLANQKLRCVELFVEHPEKDGAILMGILIGLLLAIPLCFILFLLWQRGYFFCGNQGPASFSRAFYKRTPNDDES